MGANQIRLNYYIMLLILIVIGMFQLSCNNNDSCSCDFDDQIIMSNDSIINYATKEIIEENATSYERYFNRFDLDELFLKSTEAYRLTIVGSITNFAKTYELNNDISKIILTVKEFSKSSNGVKKIELFNEKSIHLSQEQWLKFQSTIRENCFWAMKCKDEKERGYLDGTRFGLEGVNGKNNCTNSKYQIVSRLSPDSSRFLNICEEFFKLDSLNFRNIKEW